MIKIYYCSGLGPPKCPACQSTLVIQTDDFNTPTAENSKNQMKSGGDTQKDILDSNLKHSESQSSIGETYWLLELKKRNILFFNHIFSYA